MDNARIGRENNCVAKARGGRRGQFFIIASVIIILNLLAIGSMIRQGYRGGSDRPSQEIAIAGDFERTMTEIYKSPYSFRRNIGSFQQGLQKSSSFSSQIILSCVGESDCLLAKFGDCMGRDCNITLSIKGPSMDFAKDYSGTMGS